jgi:hypothetical protein
MNHNLRVKFSNDGRRVTEGHALRLSSVIISPTSQPVVHTNQPNLPTSHPVLPTNQFKLPNQLELPTSQPSTLSTNTNLKINTETPQPSTSTTKSDRHITSQPSHHIGWSKPATLNREPRTAVQWQNILIHRQRKQQSYQPPAPQILPSKSQLKFTTPTSAEAHQRMSLLTTTKYPPPTLDVLEIEAIQKQKRQAYHRRNNLRVKIKKYEGSQAKRSVNRSDWKFSRESTLSPLSSTSDFEED